MALQVWLPLNGNLNNQGLTNVTVTNNGATVDNNGKIGKCYSFSASSAKITNTLSSSVTSAVGTMSCWVKFNSFPSSGAWYCLMQLGTAGGFANCRLGVYMQYQTGIVVCINGSSDSNLYTHSLTTNQWYHLCTTFDGTTVRLYIDGVEVWNKTAVVGSYTTAASTLFVGGTNNYYFKGYMNDVRYYSTALSPKEIEILSRGLVCHYPLSDVSNQTPNNVATYPTFDTSSGHGGWNHWGNTGNLGHYSQNTDSQYIFRHGQTYSHCFSDESTATAPYLLYQSPSFSGGYRSLCAIIKEENGAEIKESIVYPAWNAAVSGSIPSGKWTSITPLGDGFYLGKVEGFQQDGSNNLVGLYVRAGYKVYVSEFYIENDRKVCSDFFYPSTTVYDTSGYQYNGTINGSLTVSSDTARYSVSTEFSSTTYIETPSPCSNVRSASFWIKTTKPAYAVAWADAKSKLAFGIVSAGDILVSCNGGYTKKYPNSVITANVWQHIVIVRGEDIANTDLYVNGVKQTPGTSTDFWTHTSDSLIINGRGYSTPSRMNSQMSDFRLYATALSAEQAAELYNTAVSVANNGTLMGYELVEV